jgi:hypothetical protein
MAAQVAAAASGSAATGALGMAAFGLGTAPLMVAFGTAGSMIPRVWKQRMMSVLAIGVILFGVVFIKRGLIATGSPVTFLTLQTAITGTGAGGSETSYATGADGVVEVPLVIENVQFVPQVVQIPADTPVRLIVDRREDVACSAQLYLPQLNILVDLAPHGVTPVDIPATAAGSYTLTCGMSMMSGQLVVGDTGGTGLLGRPALWIVLAIAGAIGSLVVAQRRDKRIASADSNGTSPAGLFGFTPLEIALIAATVVVAIVAGLSLGGSFS